MFKIGITGEIGSGKSTIISRLQHEFKCPVFIADNVAKHIMSNKHIAREISYTLGKILDEDGSLSRKSVAEIIFRDPLKKTWLEQYIHPMVDAAFEQFCFKHKFENVVVYESALLHMNNRWSKFDYIVQVICDDEERIERVMERDGRSREQVELIIKNQKDNLDLVYQDFHHYTIETDKTHQSDYNDQCKKMITHIKENMK